MDKVLVERVLLKRGPSAGSREAVRIAVGFPYWVDENNEAACSVVVEGLLAERQIRGNDLWQALELALSFVHTYLTSLPAEKRLYWPDGDVYEGD